MATKPLILEISSVLFLLSQNRVELVLKQDQIPLLLGDEVALFLQAMNYSIPASIQVMGLSGDEIKEAISLWREYPQISWANVQAFLLAKNLNCPLLIEGRLIQACCQRLGLLSYEIAEFMSAMQVP